VDGRDQPEHRDHGQCHADRNSFARSDAQPPSVCVENPAPLVEVAAPERDWCGDERADERDERRKCDRLAPPGKAVDEPEGQSPKPPAQKSEDEEAENDADHPGQIRRAVVAAGPLDLLGIEDLTAAT
jgi:hypothetical protein